MAAPVQPLLRGNFHSVDPRFYIDYKVTPEINTYVSASKGFRSGGFNGVDLPSFQPETVWTYELGLKTASRSGVVSADIALFYSDYTNYQIVGQTSNNPLLGPITSNAGNADLKGVEWGVNWRPLDHWTFSFQGDYVTSVFYKITSLSSTYDVGDGLDFFPKYAFTASLERELNWNGKPGYARLDYNQHGRETFRDRTVSPYFFSESDIIHTLNFNSSLQWTDYLSFGVFAQNLLNDRGLADPLAIEGLGSRSRPLTIGLNFNLKVQ